MILAYLLIIERCKIAWFLGFYLFKYRWMNRYTCFFSKNSSAGWITFSSGIMFISFLSARLKVSYFLMSAQRINKTMFSSNFHAVTKVFALVFLAVNVVCPGVIIPFEPGNYNDSCLIIVPVTIYHTYFLSTWVYKCVIKTVCPKHFTVQKYHTKIIFCYFQFVT